jgi:hypothetical protein
MATRWDNLPGLNDDVIERVKEDLAKAKKGRDVDSSNLKGGAKESVREAGTRARNRNLGRMGAAQAAFSAGYEAGRELDERTGLGKKIVDKSGLGDVVDRMVNSRDKVTLTPEARQRVSAGDTDSDAGTYEPRRTEGDFGAYKRGGKVKKMASGGMTSKASSASKRADGIAQRGKTKGRYL